MSNTSAVQMSQGGARFDKGFEVIQVLGSGRAGIAYEVEDKQSGQSYAIKKIWMSSKWLEISKISSNHLVKIKH